MADYYSLNICVMVGTLGKDPDIWVDNENKNKKATFPLGTKEIRLGRKIKSDWIRIVAWSPMAEFCQKYLLKGKKVIVVGRIEKIGWRDHEDKLRAQVQIRAERVIALDKYRDSDEITESDEREIEEQDPY